MEKLSVKGNKYKKANPPHQHNKIQNRLRAYFIYCLSSATAHGFIHIVRRKRSLCEKLLWIFFIALACVPCVLLGRNAWNHYWEHPTVTTIERNHWDWKIDFPTVTMCPRIFRSNSFEVLENYNVSYNILTEEKMEAFQEFLGDLFFGNYSTYSQLEKYKKDFDVVPPEEYIRLNEELIYLEPDIFPEFIDRRNFTKILTEFGYCYTYNSKVAPYFTSDYLYSNPPELFEEEELDRVTAADETPGVGIQNIPIEKLMIFIYGQNEYIDVKSTKTIITEYRMSYFYITIQILWTPIEVRRFSIEQRNCRFDDESNLKHSPVYSYTLCKIDCRIELALQLCNCLPFYYRNIYKHPVCNIDGMICLSKQEHKLIELVDESGNALCHCLQNCNHNFVTIWPSQSNTWLFGNAIYIQLLFMDPVRYKRSIIFSESDLLVQIGGVAGLCYGLSILSLVELIYFLTLRFYWAVIKGRAV